MWNVLICNDDAIFSQQLKEDITKIAGGKVKHVDVFQDVDQFIFYIADRPDEANIVMIDIKLKGVKGIELAEHVLTLQPGSQIVFISGYDKYHSDIYAVEHAYFLKKPIVLEHLKKAVFRAGERINDLQMHSLVISNKEGIYRIPFHEILFFENERRKIHVHTIRRRFSYYGKFEDLMLRLDDRFQRCHNSYIVNIAKVRELRDKKFYFETGKAIPISKTYYGHIRESFLRYVEQEILNGGGLI